MLIEVLLKFLVGVVDVELLKPIHLEAEKHINILILIYLVWSAETYRRGQMSHLKVLKAKDVEDADGFKILFAFNLLIYLEDDPGETLGI